MSWVPSPDLACAIVAASPDAILVYDGAGRIADANPAAAALLAASPGCGARGRSLTDFVARSLEPAADDRWLFADGWNGDVRLRRGDGAALTASGRVRRLSGAGDRRWALFLRPEGDRPSPAAAAVWPSRALVEQIPAIVMTWSVDDSVRLAYVSPQIERILGYTPAEAIAEPEFLFRHTHPEDLPRIQAAEERAVAGGLPLCEEYRLRAKDGRWVWVRDEAAPIGAGPTATWQAVLVDITAQKAAEAAVRSSEARFRALTEHHSDLVSVFAADGTRTYASPSTERILGYAPAELIGPNAPKVDHPADTPRMRAFFQALRREPGAVERVETRVIRRDGAVRWLEVVGQNRLADPDVAGIVLTGRDVTERKEAERALRASEERFRAAFEDAATGMALVGLDGRFLRANRALCALLGYREDDLQSLTFQDVTHPADLPAILELRGRLHRGEITVYELEKRYVRQDGAIVWVHLATSLVRDDEGAPRYLVSQIQDITGRKEAEAALAAERDLLQTLMNGLPEAIWVKDTASRLLRLNPAAARTLGLSDPAAAIGKTGFDPFPEALTAEYLADERRVIATGEPLLNKLDRQGEGEDATSWLVSIVPLRDATGTVVGVVGSGREITEQRRAEEALRRAEQRYRELFDEAPVMYVATRLTDGGAIVTDCNRMFVRTLGYTRRSQVVGRSVADFFAPASRRAVLDGGGYDRAMRGKLPPVERQLLTRYGQTVDVLVQAGPEFDEQGQPCGTRAAFVDITERKRLEGELRAAEARFRTLVEQLPAMVYVLANDDAQSALYISPRSGDLLRISPEEALARTESWLAYVHPDDRDRVAADEARSLASGSPLRIEYRHRRGDGTYVWVLDECVPLRDATGEIVAWQGVLFDVEEQRRWQEELRAAKEAAEAASRLKSAFLSTMSHELRTPLNAILGYAHLLLDGLAGALTAEQAGDVRRIAEGADRLLALVNDVLDLSRIEAGGIELSPEEVDPASVIADICAEIAPLAAAKGLRLETDLPAALPRLWADPLRVHQVLLNLVGNAVKFTDAGSVRVTAHATADGVEIAVADTGIGIPAAEVPRIFEEFRQADSGTARRFGGSGLGLAIAKRLVELHGGTITVESAPGRGSTFTVTVPRAGAANDEAKPVHLSDDQGRDGLA